MMSSEDFLKSGVVTSEATRIKADVNITSDELEGQSIDTKQATPSPTYEELRVFVAKEGIRYCGGLCDHCQCCIGCDDFRQCADADASEDTPHVPDCIVKRCQDGH